MKNNPNVSIIIPNYNGKMYLENCLKSLKCQTYQNFEVIVVDNASTDNSVNYIEDNFSDFRIIINSQNYGFSKAINIGSKNAKGVYLVVLNNDTELESNWLAELINFTNDVDDFGSCQSKILLFDEKNIVNTIGNDIFFVGQGWSGGYGTHEQLYNDVTEVTYCSGASMLIKRDVLERVGYFDEEEVFMYHDDLDLGWRLLLFGYKNYLVPKSVAYHKYQYSRNSKKYYYLEVSRFVSIIKYYRLKTIILISPAFLIMEMGIILFSISDGWFQDKIRAYYYIVRNFKRLAQKRKHIQKARKISDREVCKYFEGDVKFIELNNICLRLVNPFFKLYWEFVKKII